MITVHYGYRRKGSGDWAEASATFVDVRKALRFMWSLKNKEAYLYAYSCYDPEDKEYLDERVSFRAINGRACRA